MFILLLFWHQSNIGLLNYLGHIPSSYISWKIFYNIDINIDIKYLIELSSEN